MTAGNLAGRVRRDGDWLALETDSGTLFYDVRLSDFAAPESAREWWRQFGEKGRWRGFMPEIVRIVRGYLAEHRPATMPERIRWAACSIMAKRAEEAARPA